MKNILEIKKSKVSGKGVFADNNINKFQTICFLEGEVMNIKEMIKRVDDEKERGSDSLGIDDEVYLDLDELSRTFNHSCNPNAFIMGKNELVALKNIKKGEEITYDYSTTMNDNEEKIKNEGDGGELWTCKCRCGSDNCRNVIDQFKTLPKETRAFYIRNKFMPDFMLKKFKL
ncbi:MAG: SET domain-containing protein [Candidatus Pacearchaeota archaeon]|nr:SET domain-containing protein [Candidatus Pacearchaeota archaeon]